MKFATLIAVLFLAGSCGKIRFFKKSTQEKQDPIVYATGNLRVNVYYEEGAEPYADSIANVKIWTVLEQNLKALFPGKSIVVPKDLSAMSKIGDQNQSVWTLAEIDSLGESLGQKSSSDTAVYNIFFVKGHADGTNGQYVIGLHLSNTQTLMLFKETVVASDSSADAELVRRYVEQSTVVHEMGHAVGLVDNGVAMTSEHSDTAHKPHCSNPKCVMYWENEGANALKTFVLDRITNPSLVMFDQACLKDVTSHK